MIEIFVLGVLADLFSAGAHPIDTEAAAPEQLSAAACRACHPKQFDEWQGSRHQLAWTNGLFQHDYRRSGRQWCRNCHTPLSAQQVNAYENPLANEGVNCVACHVRDGIMFAKTRRAGSPHQTGATPEFGSARYCGGCHQFNFPIFDGNNEFAHYSAEPMQNTVAQYESQAIRDKPDGCLGCHAPTGSHEFPGAHRLEMLEQALSLETCREDSMTLRITVANRGAGHNVPTGDVHRHILVKAWRSTAPENLNELFLGRRFAGGPDGTRKTIWDSTLPPKGHRVWRIDSQKLGGIAGEQEPVNLELRYVYGSEENPKRSLGEPAYQTVLTVRERVSQIKTCDASAAIPASSTKGTSR